MSTVTPALAIDLHRLSGLDALERGIEKESLRVSESGELSTRPHPEALGSALTHSSITTDFSEAQLELITGVHPSAEAALAELWDIHRYVIANLDHELLWPSSMPCLMGDDDAIPIGHYGTSNIGMAKTVYRRGLGVRYGRLMQTISGIHYNFSVPDSLLSSIGVTQQDERTAAYLGLVRNFRRWSWLLIYAFGASPAVCKSFTRNRPHSLEPFDEGSLHLPYATCLRMGPLGYQSSAQTNLHISFNSLGEYAASMEDALSTEFPDYAAAGLKDANGEYQQLNTTILQIENEFYSTIRPKPVIKSGERPINALKRRGVKYVEVRCLDLNPFLPVGIDETQMRFLDTFLLLCLLAESTPDSVSESMRVADNQLAVVERGREPGLTLETESGPIALTDWANILLDACQDIATMLDRANESEAFTEALAAQRDKVQDAGNTPSAQVLATMRDNAQPFFHFTMDQAKALEARIAAEPMSSAELDRWREDAAASHQRQREIEAATTLSFDAFLQDYLSLEPAPDR